MALHQDAHVNCIRVGMLVFQRGVLRCFGADRLYHRRRSWARVVSKDCRPQRLCSVDKLIAQPI